MTYGYRTSFTAADRADREETIVDGRFSSSGDIALSDGSATQGAIYFADDKNTGIYSPSNDSIAFTTAGSQVLNIVAGTKTVEGVDYKTNSLQVQGYAEISAGSHDYLYGKGTRSAGISIYGHESALELVSSDSNTHASSLLFRHNNNKGFGFIHNGTDEVLELKAFTSNNNDFSINGSGANLSSLVTALKIDSSGNVTLGGGTSPSLTINASTDNQSGANEAKVEFRYNQSHANDSIGYIKLVEGGDNSFSGYLSFGVPYLSGENPATRDGIVEIGNKADLHIKSTTNSWDGGILIEDDAGGDGWNIHPESTGSHAGHLKFAYNDNVDAYSMKHVLSLKPLGDVEVLDGNLELHKKLLTGHISSDSAPDGFPSLVQIDSTAGGGSLSIGRHSADSNGPILLFHKSRAGTTNGNTAVHKGDSLGAMRWYAADGTDRSSFSASIICENDQAAAGAAAGNRTPGRLVFQTTKDEADAVSSTTALTLNSSQNATFAGDVTSNNLAGNNLIINGAMRVAQRGTVSDHGTSPSYTAVDRFSTRTGSSYNFDVTTSQSTDAPNGFSHSLKVTPDSTSTPSGSENGAIQTKLEGQDLIGLGFGSSDAQKITLSFYAKSGSSGAGQYSLDVRMRPTAGSDYIQTRSFTVTTSWQRFSFTFENNGVSTSNDIISNTNSAMEIVWHLATGPDDLTSEITTWTVTSPMKGVTGQDNFMSNTDNEFYLTGVQLEIGSVATPFERKSYGDDMRECQRYYFTSPANANSYLPGEGSPGRSRICMYWPTEMRGAPTVTATNWNMYGMKTGVVGYRTDGSIDTLPAITAVSEL